jgi:hypothetical protein
VPIQLDRLRKPDVPGDQAADPAVDELRVAIVRHA